MSDKRKARGYQDELRRKKKRRFAIRIFSIFLVIGLAAGAAVYFLFFGGYFEIQKVNISVPEGISENEVRESVNSWLDKNFLGIKKRDNVLVLSFNQIKKLLAKNFPKIESVDFSRNSTHEISVSVISRKPEGIWCLSVRNKCFYFDRTGVAYSETGPSSGALFSTVDDQRDRGEIELGQKIAPDNWLSNINIVKKLLAENNLNALDFKIPPDSFDEFEVKTAPGWKILFSNTTDIASQIRAMLILFSQKLSQEQINSLQYVDLRIQDRVYYK